MRIYANFLGKRYQNRKNLIWILGGDVRGDVGYDVFCLEGEILKSYNPERIIAYHPFGRTSSSLWFHNEPWLDMNLFQSGHRRYDQASLGEWDDNAERVSTIALASSFPCSANPSNCPILYITLFPL